MFDIENATELEKTKFWLREALVDITNADCGEFLRIIDRYIDLKIKESKAQE